MDKRCHDYEKIVLSSNVVHDSTIETLANIDFSKYKKICFGLSSASGLTMYNPIIIDIDDFVNGLSVTMSSAFFDNGTLYMASAYVQNNVLKYSIYVDSTNYTAHIANIVIYGWF